MAYVDKINVQGTDYDINDKRLPESSNVIEVAKDLKMGIGKLAKILEDITDSQGHKRFVGGDGTINSGVAGLSSSFLKWSLSGTHLMFVFAGNLADETVLANGTFVGTFALPSWIMQKIVPVWGGTWIEKKQVELIADDNTTQNIIVHLGIDAPNNYLYVVSSGVTLTADRAFRIQFDLLIDND